jgi:hypothetical protein
MTSKVTKMKRRRLPGCLLDPNDPYRHLRDPLDNEYDSFLKARAAHIEPAVTTPPAPPVATRHDDHADHDQPVASDGLGKAEPLCG